MSCTKKEVSFELGELNPGETKEVSYYVRTSIKPSLEEYAEGKDEVGYYTFKNNEKQYITEVPNIYITNKASVSSSILANAVESNEVKNELEYANFSMDTRIDYDRDLDTGFESNFTLFVKNISTKDLKNVIAEFNVGQVYEFISGTIEIAGSDISAEITYDAEKGKRKIGIAICPQFKWKTGAYDRFIPFCCTAITKKIYS